jgi:hypothetical protein
MQIALFQIFSIKDVVYTRYNVGFILFLPSF